MKHPRPSLTSPLRWGSLALAAALVACGGSEKTADPLQSYRDQTLQWGVCDPTIMGSDILEGEALEVARCAAMRAPMDYTHPERGDVQIALLLVPSSDPAQRKGAIVLNPGGPGGDGLGMAFTLPNVFRHSDPDHPLGALQLQVLREYDMVGFSPRGMGASTTLTCTTNELVRPVNTTAAQRFAPGNIDNEIYNARKKAEACQKNPLARHIHSVATARDLDLLRSLMGNEKLHYLGYSYGTWLGTVYARLFPERVGRMVLDSAMDITDPFHQGLLQQPMARQRLLDDVLIPYAARHPEFFGLGTDTVALRALASALPPILQSMLQESLAAKSNWRDAIDHMIIDLAAAKGLAEVWKALPENTPAAEVRQALEDRVFVPGNSESNASIKATARQWFERLSAPSTPTEPENFHLMPGDAVFLAVSCNDSVFRHEVDYWVGVGNDYIERYPLFGYDLVTPCAFWTTPPIALPPLDAMEKLDVLLVQSEFDAATATEGATQSFAQLPLAKGVFIDDEYEHGVFPYKDQCVDGAVVNFLLGESPAVRRTQCPSHPFIQDAAAQKKTDAPTERQLPQATPGSTFKDPEAARQLIEKYKSTIGRRPGANDKP